MLHLTAEENSALFHYFSHMPQAISYNRCESLFVDMFFLQGTFLAFGC
jgi:hypothetical protein